MKASLVRLFNENYINFYNFYTEHARDEEIQDTSKKTTRYLWLESQLVQIPGPLEIGSSDAGWLLIFRFDLQAGMDSFTSTSLSLSPIHDNSIVIYGTTRTVVCPYLSFYWFFFPV